MTEKQIEKYMNGTRNIFLTGPAGVGKSYLINQYIETHNNVLVCAPTGIAALNVGGETIHKLFHVPIPAFGSPSFAKGKKGVITDAMLKPLIQADTVIVDEISMCRNDVFSYMIKVLRKAERKKGSKIKLIVAGDFSQLPPIIRKNELPLMKKFDLDTSGYAFTTSEWKSCNFKVIELTEIKRQSNKEFIKVLNNIRIGKNELNYLNQFVNENPNYDDAICICGTNAEANRINQAYLDNIPGNTTALQSQKEGRTSSGLIDDVILIKEGCRIMFTANDVIHNKYANGTFGIVKTITPDYVIVEVNGEDIFVNRKDNIIYSYSVKNDVLSKKQIGTIKQYPFKLGKAITIHKSQGQTFDKVIISPDIFAAGQLYVALSRVRAPEGLTLTEEITPDKLIIDPIVQAFYNNNYTFEIKKKKKTTKTTTKKSTKSKSTEKVTVKDSSKKAKTTAKKTTPKKKRFTTKSTRKTTSAKKKTTQKKK